MKLVRFVAPDGSLVWLNPDQVCAITRAFKGDVDTGARIRCLDGLLLVQELPEVVATLLSETHGQAD